MKKRKGLFGCINKCIYDMIYIKYMYMKSVIKIEGKINFIFVFVNKNIRSLNI